MPALPGAAHRPHLQRLRDDRGVLEHVPAPGGPPRPRRLGGARVHRRRRRRRARLRGPHRRSGRPRREGRHGGRRGGRAVGEVRLRVRRPARGAGGALPRRLALHRRPRDLGLRRVRHDRRPQGRHDHLRRGERAPDAGRERPQRAPGDRRLRGRRRPRRAVGRARRGLRRAVRSRASTPPPARPTASPTRCSPATSARAPTASSTRCRVTATGKKVHYQVREQARREADEGLLQRP